MNANDLLDIIGETRDTYVYEAARKPVAKKRPPITRYLLIAAIIILMTAVTVSASQMLRIWIQHQDAFSNEETGNSSQSKINGNAEKAGVIEFRMDIEEEISGEPMSVLEVVPYFFMESDVRRVAETLFPEAEFYEAEPALAPVYSKSEIQEKIDRWTLYSTEEALLELYEYRPYQTEYQSEIAELVNTFVDRYSAMLEDAPESNPHSLCEWTFKKASYYMVEESRITSKDRENDNDDIQARVKIGDISYHFCASKRDKDDYLISTITAYPEDGSSPSGIDEEIFRAWLCRTEEPTEAQIDEINEKAESMLRQMQMGSWMIDECYVETEEINEYMNYIIHVNAVPVLNGFPVLRKMQLTNLKNEDPNAPRYYYTDVQFEFSANGDLVYFQMQSPIKVKGTAATSGVSVEIEEQIEIAKAYLSQQNFYTYGQGYLDGVTEQLGCIVEISDLEYNLTRINGENPLESYLYVPGIKLIGDVRYYGIESGKTYLFREKLTLCMVSGEDGSILMNSYS